MSILQDDSFWGDADDIINWEELEKPGAIQAFLEHIYSFHAMLLRNEDPDSRVIKLLNEHELRNVVEAYFKNPATMMRVIMPNPRDDVLCPYILILMEDYDIKTAINYKFETMMRNMGITGLHARCSVALVSGLMSPKYMDSLIDIPDFNRLCNLSCYNRIGEVELTCQQSTVAHISKEAGFEYPSNTGRLDFHLLGPCIRCSRFKVLCSKTIPCLRCERCDDGAAECGPSQHEMISRAKVVTKQIQAGGFPHNDHAKYQLYLQVTMYCGKSIMGRTEVRDMFKRISTTMLASNETMNYNVTNLPDPIKHLIHERPHFKIEFMDNGRYLVKTSDSYKANFLPEDKMVEVARKYGIPPRLLDTCNLNEYDMAYRMWVESVSNPNMIVRYTGTAYWSHDKIIAYSTIKMVTVIINPMSMITATVISRGSMYTF